MTRDWPCRNVSRVDNAIAGYSSLSRNLPQPDIFKRFQHTARFLHKQEDKASLWTLRTICRKRAPNCGRRFAAQIIGLSQRQIFNAGATALICASAIAIKVNGLARCGFIAFCSTLSRFAFK
jgi:hypothetical protein